MSNFNPNEHIAKDNFLRYIVNEHNEFSVTNAIFVEFITERGDFYFISIDKDSELWNVLIGTRNECLARELKEMDDE